MRDAKLLEARFRDLLESLPDAIILVNRDSKPLPRAIFETRHLAPRAAA